MTVHRVQGGIWCLEVVGPVMALGPTLTYLIEGDDGFVLVDPGWDIDESWDSLIAGIGATGHGIENCSGVLLTHAHPDHHGLSERVREKSGAWVAMHEAEAATLDRFSQQLQTGIAGPMLALAGAPDATPDIAASSGLVMTEMARPDRLVGDGDPVPGLGRRVQAIWTPGHSPGHLCYLVPDAGVLLSGDHVLPTTTPHVGMWPGEDSNPLREFLTSLDRVRTLGVEQVLPGHEHVFTGLEARVAAITSHHERRLQHVEDAVAAGATAVWEIAQRIPWSEPWDEVVPMMRVAALGEVLAHLRHLEVLGRITRQGDAFTLAERR